DERLDRLAALFNPKKTTHAEVRLHDLPGLIGAKGELSGASASTIAQTDAIIHVVRAFDRPDVPHPQGSIDPHRDIEAMDLELTYYDLAVLERRLDKLNTIVRSARPAERDAGQKEQALLLRAKKVLEAGQALRGRITAPEDLKGLANFGLVTLKPLLLLVSLDESDAARIKEIEAEYGQRYAGLQTAVSAICGRLEAELTELPPEDADSFRQELGLAEPAAPRILALAPQLLGLITFFTVGEDECRAWQVRQGATAQEAAGKIHSDLQRGFIRAETIEWDKLLELGSLPEARKHGLLRSEGKSYEVKDGDIMHVLFQV
ncbi:MAG TPA: DUF933 domain-containing protein, partial [Dehalococcoidia bacterium]|nr:DUF933 domain-containing protein [Dehalococcoidia bacterium]